MNILITGNMGYVGPVLVRFLKNSHPNAKLIGYDSGFFAHALSAAKSLPEVFYQTQYFGDIRNIGYEILNDIDAVVHLSAISNDPMGKEFEEVTRKINLDASVNLVEMCIKSGVKNFVFASSCSMYGAGGTLPKTEEDDTNPLTAYAKSKIGVEQAVSRMELGSMTFTSLRFATACGMSDRLRLDLVLNDFVASALLSKKITVLSDGSPWRPLIDVRDMARAIDWAICRSSKIGGQFLAINVGKNENNFQVKDIAEAVAEAIPGTKIEINTSAKSDARSYQVDFSLLEDLAPGFTPLISLRESISSLQNGISRMYFENELFRESEYIRLVSLKNHCLNDRLDKELNWKKS